MLYKSRYKIESSRLKDWDYSTPWWYFITICTRNFKCWFGHVDKGKIILNDLGNIVQEEWIKTKEIRLNVDLDYSVIMPNHFHGITIIEGPEFARSVETHHDASLRIIRNSLSDIIRGFKGSVTKRIHKLGIEKFHWQPRFYDHIIRNEADLRRIRNYIQNNTLKWELDEYFTKER